MKHFSRRELLLGASLLAMSRNAEAGINNPGTASSQPVTPGFNGGLKQTNTVSPFGPGCYMFINFIKSGSELQYLNPPTDTSLPKVPSLELDADGYPTTLVAGTGGYGTAFTLPNATQYAGRWVLKWDGTGTVTPGNFNFTTNLTQSNRVEFTNNDTSPSWTSCTIFIQAFSNAPNYVKNLRMCRLIDEALMDAGQLIYPDHLTLMKSSKPGAIRSLGWGGGFDGTNTALIATWAQRRSRNYVQYGGGRYDSTKFPGVTGAACTTTRSGTDYTLAYPGFTLTDKVLVHLIWDSDIPHRLNTTVTLPWSTTNGVAININWPSHGLAVGNTFALGNNTGNVPPSAINLATQQIFFVNNVVDADNFTFSATSGGSSILATATASGNMLIATVARININSTGFVKLTDFQTPNPSSVGSVNGQTPKAGLSTIIYDATTGWFHISASGPSLMCGGPPEVFIDYCAAIGANPWMTAPFMAMTTGGALGAVTDYMPSWVTYAKNTYAWMKPLIEPYNETWNPSLAGLGTHYASTLAYTIYPTAGSNRPVDETYGKWVSDLGQAMSTVFGNDRTKYSMLSMGQADTWRNPASANINDARLTSHLYVSLGGSPAYLWTDRVGAACYYFAQETDTVAEIIHAFGYSVTNAGNPSGQSAIAEAYAATANSGVNTTFTLAAVKNIFGNIKNWGLGLNGTSTVPNAAGGNTVKGMVAYEGGYGPDVPPDGGDASTSVALTAGAITQASPCVVTLTNNTTTADGTATTGNPGVVGMMVNIQFVSGMTQLNNPGPGLSNFTSGSANIAHSNALLVNQAVMFTTTPPSPFAINTPYYVLGTGLSTTNIQISATRGGTAIVASATSSNVTTQEGWFISAVGASTITLDVDSTGFTAWTNASQAKVTYTASRAYTGTLRLASVQTAAMGVNNTQMYTDFFSFGGGGFTAEYPSNFIYFGNAGAWAVLNPNIYTALTPQWNSIVAQQ